MEISSSAQEKLNRLDKGLSSLLFHEQVEVLAQAINFVEENPFPYFVNTLMVRLAKAFRAERSIYSNAVRLRIVKLVEECGPYLNVVFSRDQIVQEVIYVSHSTDFKARCLMLMFLEKLAPIIYDNKNFHHLLLESLDSSYQLEVTAAISASSALAQHSFEFASAVVEKLSGMVCSQQTDFSTKLRVINLMATFKENFEVTKKCMALANRLLRENFDQSLTVAILASLTSLAYRSSLGVTEQIALLFTQLYKAVPQRGLIKAILGCLQKLAEMPHHWSNTQITQLLDFMEKIRDLNSSLVFRSWLRCLEILTTTGIHSLIIHEKLGTCWTLLSEPDLAVRISAIKVFMNILFKLPSEQLHVIMFEALVNTCSDLKATNQVVNKKKFYKLLTDYLKTGSCPQTGTARIMEHLLKTSPEDQDFELVLDSLNVICDSDPEACPYISAWAQAILREADFSKRQPPLALISLFLAPVEMSEEKAKILFDKVVDYVDDFMVYRIARTAFRNGHWKLVAAPLLESINEKTESRETKNWLVALTNIAHSQVTKVEAEDFAAGHNFLNQAFLLLGKFESLDLATQDFNFNYRYVQCLQTTFYATTKILEMLNHNRFYLTAVSEAPNVQKVISVACDDLAKMVIEKSLPRWNNLYSRSFDADQQTLFHIQLWTIYTNCLISVLQFFCQESINHFQMAVNPDLNTTNRQFQSMVFWMKSQVDKFWEHTHPEVTKRVTELNLQLLQNLLEKFWSTPIYMPRYFFQNLHKTVIKLNLLPQPKEKDGSISIPARRLPVTVEGRIQTNNPNRIETLTINLTSYPLKDSTDQAKYSRNVELQENENYFKAQFLLNLLKSTKITVSLTFTDVNTKRSWECDATAQLIVSVNE